MIFNKTSESNDFLEQCLIELEKEVEYEQFYDWNGKKV